MLFPDEAVRDTRAEINLDNLAHNVKEFNNHIGKNTMLMAVVKADGYGHGGYEVARCALENGADWLGVAALEEGVVLRLQGVKEPILILGYISPRQVKTCIEYDLVPTIFTRETARECSRVAQKKGEEIKVHVKVDTGMGRVGVLPGESLEFVEFVDSLPGIRIEGVYTHFSVADDSDKRYTWNQYETFKQVVQELEAKGLNIPLKHACNSAAAIDLPEMHLDLVRIGISLYGSYTSPHVSREVQLKPVMALKSKVSYVKTVPPGTSISYGRKFITDKESVVATVPIGYGDGYSRLLSNKGNVIHHGKRLPIIGAVCMDQCMFLADDSARVELGDEVVLLGSQGEEIIDADEIADKLGTISYEIYCMIDKRVPRYYYKNDKLIKAKTLLDQ